MFVSWSEELVFPVDLDSFGRTSVRQIVYSWAFLEENKKACHHQQDRFVVGSRSRQSLFVESLCVKLAG